MISILLSARPSYAKLQPLLSELLARHADVEVVACGAALLHRYGKVVDQVRTDFPGLRITPLYATLDGSELVTSVKETALLMSGLADHYARTKPTLVVVIADRHETAAASLAAAYLNIPLAHIQGGEHSGNIDDQVRDVNSVLAAYHFPATDKAHHTLQVMCPRAVAIYQFGCPSLDVAKAALCLPPLWITDELGGVGPRLDLTQPFLTVLYHPETEQPAAAYEQMMVVLETCSRIPLPRLVFWPGQDAGAEGSAKAIREYLGTVKARGETWHALRTASPSAFMRLLNQTAVLIGNSSAGIREASYVGTPVVNIGSRQDGRERAENVVDCRLPLFSLEQCITRQIRQERYPSSLLYGRGDAAPRIAQKLLEVVRQ